MFDHVVQRESKDWAIATAAVVAHVSYREALSHSPVAPGNRGLPLGDTLRLLESLTGTPWQITISFWFGRFAKFEFPNQLCVVITRRPWHWRTIHCLAVEGEWVHDSAFPHTFRRHEYPWKHWRIVQVLRPAVPDKLAEVRRINLSAKFRAGMQSAPRIDQPSQP